MRDQSEKLAQDLHEMSKPTNRSAEDEHLNEYLRAQIRDDDPMAQYISEKALKNNPPARPVHQGPAYRFGIPPGYRWDCSISIENSAEPLITYEFLAMIISVEFGNEF